MLNALDNLDVSCVIKLYIIYIGFTIASAFVQIKDSIFPRCVLQSHLCSLIFHIFRRLAGEITTGYHLHGQS